MTSHQWAISVIKIKTVGSCTIFLFCLVDLFFLFFLLVLRAYRKTGRSVAATNPFKDFPKSFGCFVGEAKRRTLAVLLSLISSLGIQTQMPCSTFPFHLAAAKMQWRELCIMLFYTLEWCTSILEISTASVGWATALCVERKCWRTTTQAKARRSLLLLLLLLLRCCE